MIDKKEDIGNYLVKVLEEAGLKSVYTTYAFNGEGYFIRVFFEPISSDDLSLLECYLKIKYVCKKVDFIVYPEGENVLTGNVENICLFASDQALDQFINTEIFKSFLAFDKFNL